MSLEVFEKLESKVQQAIDTITLLQMEIEELKEKNNSLSQEVQNAQHSREELEREKPPAARTAEWLAGSSAGASGTYGRSVISLGKYSGNKPGKAFAPPGFFMTIARGNTSL